MSNEVVISVENLGKRYRISHQQPGRRYVALRDVLTEKARGFFRRAKKVEGSAAHSPLSPLPASRTSSEDFWALRNVSFEVKPGEVVGIIGRNGAGKSTLLKILSRITEPTEGRVKVRGRIASLLEVGTGFHPELTGRENIFLNGAILGMTRAEIKGKFDEIVAFAEVEKFLDTAVKHYSSGMYVRLAFAVAAHLEPEILIVDEVLAVGDVEFQKKCLGKMQEVSKGGRTVLFVSHNMAAISSLTSRGIVLDSGQITFNGRPAEAIESYVQLGHRRLASPAPIGRGKHTAILGVRLLDETGEAVRNYSPGKPIRLEVTFETDGVSSLSLEAFLLDATRHKLGLVSLHHFHGVTLPESAGRYLTLLELEPMWLASGNYIFDVTTSVVNRNWDHYIEDALTFHVIYSNPCGHSWDFKHSFGFGALAMTARVAPKFEAH